jgi:predicted metal-dependent phosphoesterase TrpH
MILYQNELICEKKVASMTVYRVEFHCHTVYSKDSLTKPEDLVRYARHIGLDRLIVTDHNSTGGAIVAKAIDPELVIIGEEIMTTQGELLASFMTEEIPPQLSPMDTIRRLRDQGAFISVSHPLDPHRGWKLDDLLEILSHVDAIETFNSRCMRAEYNDQALAFAKEHEIPGTVGSDAHVTYEVGRAVLVAPPFSNADELRAVIRKSDSVTKLSSPAIHLTSRYAVIMKKLFPGLTPGK